MTKISIITINRNNKDGLRKTMQSVLDQDFDDFEYIVVDGASDDGSLDVIQEFEPQFAQKGKAPFQYESKPDRGIFHAMNKGIVKANGEYLLFLNSGDYLAAPTVLSDFSRIGATEDYVSGNVVVTIEGHNEIRKNPEKVDFLFLHHQAIHHQATFIKRTAFELYGMYNEGDKIRGDWEHSFRSIVMGGASYKHVELTVSFYDITGISSSGLLKDRSQQEKKIVYLSIMPEYIVDALEYYKELEESFSDKMVLYNEYMNIKNGKMGFVVRAILKIKEKKHRFCIKNTKKG